MGAPPFRHAARFAYARALDAPIILSTRAWPVPRKGKTGMKPVFPFLGERGPSVAVGPLARSIASNSSEEAHRANHHNSVDSLAPRIALRVGPLRGFVDS